MAKRIVHVVAVFLAGIITGGQYVVSFDYRTAQMSAAFYTEKMQYAIHHIGNPLFFMLIAATIMNFLAAALHRKDRRTCLIILASGACFLVGGLITRFGNIPLLDIIDTWPVSSPPTNWSEIADRWYVLHSVRFAIDVAGFLLAIISTFTRREHVL